MAVALVEKAQDKELPVPIEWRPTLKKIADHFVAGKVPIGKSIKEIDSERVEYNHRNIRDYPESIGLLTDKTWESSVYIWSNPIWEILLDLSTVKGETSDLVLHLRVRELNGRYEFEPGLVYVP